MKLVISNDEMKFQDSRSSIVVSVGLVSEKPKYKAPLRHGNSLGDLPISLFKPNLPHRVVVVRVKSKKGELML